jgi:AraC-like DNA-binding protein
MTRNLPLIRLSAINPFLLELQSRGLDARRLLEELELPTDIPASHELFCAASSIYQLVEQSATLAEDPYFGFSIGDALDLQSWDPIASSVREAETVGQLLTLFTIHAAEHSSATRFYLRAEGERSTFGLNRVRKPPFRPGQNDAFYMGFMVRLLQRATRDHWDSTNVVFHVADPDCIPPTAQKYRVAKGDKSGVQISFPSRWLFQRFEKSRFAERTTTNETDEIPRSLIGSVRSALLPHLHETDLSVEKAASICGYSRRRLSRELRRAGTTLSKEIAKLRARKAEEDLSNTNRRVAEIAQSVGFTDPTVFSRAFKNWTGQSPQQYRRSRRSSN